MENESVTIACLMNALERALVCEYPGDYGSKDTPQDATDRRAWRAMVRAIGRESGRTLWAEDLIRKCQNPPPRKL